MDLNLVIAWWNLRTERRALVASRWPRSSVAAKTRRVLWEPSLARTRNVPRHREVREHGARWHADTAIIDESAFAVRARITTGARSKQQAPTGSVAMSTPLLRERS